MTTGLYKSPQRTGSKVECTGGGGPTRAHGNDEDDDDDDAEEEEEEAFRLRATVSTAAWPNTKRRRCTGTHTHTHEYHIPCLTIFKACYTLHRDTYTRVSHSALTFSKGMLYM